MGLPFHNKSKILIQDKTIFNGDANIDVENIRKLSNSSNHLSPYNAANPVEQNRYLATLNTLVNNAQAEKDATEYSLYLQSLPKRREYYKEHRVIKDNMAYSLEKNRQFEDHKRLLLVEKLNRSLKETL